MQIVGYLTIPEAVVAPTLQDKTVNITATETAQTETLEKDSGYDGLGEVTINVSAIPSDYVGSGVTQRTSSDLAASGDTVTAPAGYYENQATKSVASGTEGTPTATKGNVSNHSVSVTPSVTNSAGYISGGTHTGTAVTVSADELVSGSQTIEENDTYDVTNLASVTVNVPTGSTINNQDKSVTPTESAQSVTYDSGYTGLGTVSVGAISSSYVGSGITRRDSDDLSASGATVTAPAGYYGSAASKTIASGTEGTPSATKGSVSNHAISVTPSVTNSAGYIAGGTHSGTAVSVSASELVSGTLTVDSSGTKDVTNYASASIPAGTAGTPTATKGTVSNHSVTVTPSVTNSAGWVASETKTGTAVTVQASELDSGTKSITANGTNQDVVGYAAVDVAVPNSYSAGDEGKVVDDGALVSQTAHADVTPTTSDQTIDTTTNNSIKVKGDADLVAGNIKKDVEIFGVTGTYEGSGGGGQVVTDLVTGEFTQDYVFTETKIGRAFANITGNHDLYFPNCTTLRVQNYAFENSIVKDVYFPLLSGAAQTAFRGCKAQHIYAPLITSIGLNGFDSCTELLGAFYPKATCNTQAFRGCTKLETAVIKTIGNYYQSFLNCSSLKSVDILENQNQSKIDNSFTNATELNVLVIRASTMYPLTNTTAFTGTKFDSGGTGGTLYVPSALISSYQSASNWSTILGYSTNSIKSIESTHTDPNAPIDLTLYYADGTLIPTT